MEAKAVSRIRTKFALKILHLIERRSVDAHVVEGIIKVKVLGKQIAAKEFSKGRGIRKITHTFVKSNVTCHFDLIRFRIQIVGMTK